MREDGGLSSSGLRPWAPSLLDPPAPGGFIQRQGLKGLMEIADAIKRYPDTGQSYRLLRFLAGLYNGTDYPFDLTDLRGLDARLADACLALLSLDRLGQREVHTWGVIDGPQLEAWLTRSGLVRECQGRYVARQLYQDKFGDAGHPEDSGAG